MAWPLVKELSWGGSNSEILWFSLALFFSKFVLKASIFGLKKKVPIYFEGR